ncbi:hydroxyneurosporene dehydrogenase [Streptomyces sp. NPDC051963]|uniref:hydroxyneurosporene dehydrogenase n=1 Tax=Streptomyces sp. NPDC051963 TaxID=3365678 RepID=UPI0037D38E19
MGTSLARLGSAPADFDLIGIEPAVVQSWEDGRRTDGSAGTYEWWYFDAHLDDGAKLVVAFFTKDFADVGRPLSPMIRIDLDLPDGRSHGKVAEWKPEKFSASQEGCDVRIGDHFFRGDLHAYTISARIENVAIEVTLTGDIPSWRPATGHWYFGAEGEKEFNWLPAVPQGRVMATYTVDGAARSSAGVGYHDHNWGNAPMNSLINHWYWGRGGAGPYAVIASYITAEKAYGSTPLPVFMLAKGGRVIADDPAKVSFETLGVYTDVTTGKPVGNVVRYTYADGDDTYTATFTRHRDLSLNKLIDSLQGPKRLAAKLVRFDGAYLRFEGELRIEHLRAGSVVESHTDSAIWELMYMGRTQ